MNFMTNLWKFDVAKLLQKKEKSPKEILEEQCSYLATMTNNKVTAYVTDDDTETFPYFVESNSVDVDKNPFVLGDVGDTDMYLYEFWISSPKTPKYKFRVFWIYYNMDLYPAMIKLEENIANELNLSTALKIESKEHFIAELKDILNSKYLLEVIKKLLWVN